uniref:Protein HGH1 homolog n=1 Tax=Oryza glaberrima TaxID=4538 RepID=I1P6J6_ORYGL
ALSARLVSLGAVVAAMDVVAKRGGEQPGLARSLVMLLANLTQVDSGVAALLQVGDEKMQGLYVAKLVRSFCRSSSESEEEDIFEHVASILVNISKVEAGRRILMEPKRGLLKQIIRQSDSTNQLRKKGVVSTIRNCCFEADTQIQNLLSLAEYIWPALLLPVAGKKIYSEEDRSKMPPELANALSHEREAVENSEIRQQALEAIYMIVLQDEGRRAFWSVNGPRILQVGYEDEEDPKVMEAYELIGSLLNRDVLFLARFVPK